VPHRRSYLFLAFHSGPDHTPLRVGLAVVQPAGAGPSQCGGDDRPGHSPGSGRPQPRSCTSRPSRVPKSSLIAARAPSPRAGRS
jgi:hypothetical protein